IVCNRGLRRREFQSPTSPKPRQPPVPWAGQSPLRQNRPACSLPVERREPAAPSLSRGGQLMTDSLSSPKVTAVSARLFTAADQNDPEILARIQQEADERFGG